MKKLMAGLMVLAMLGSAGAALADTGDNGAANRRAAYSLDELGVRMFVDDSWYDYAVNYDVVIELDYEYDDQDALKTGMMIMLQAPYDSSTGNTLDYDAAGGILGMSVCSEAVEAADAIRINEFAGWQATEMGTANGYQYTLYINPQPDTAKLDEDGLSALAAVQESFASEPGRNFEIYAPEKKPYAPKTAGEFSTQDIYGNAVDSSIFAGAEYTLVDIWGTYCSPCINEMPALTKLAEEYAGRVQFLGIVVDAYNDDRIEAACGIVENAGVKYTCIVPDSVLQSTLLPAAQYIPTKFIVDSSGNVVSNAIVGGRTEQELRTLLDGLSGQ